MSLTLVWSCKTTSVAKNKPSVPTSNKTEISETSYTSFLNEILKEAKFEQVKVNSKINAEVGKFIPTLDAVIYIEKNKKVWLNASAFLFNVARGIATPEGVKVQEKLNKTYIESDFTYLNRLLNVNFINYDALQNLLIGRAFVPISEENFSFTPVQSGYILHTKKPQDINVNGKKVSYQISLQYSSTFDLNKVHISEISEAKNQLEVHYEHWENLGIMKFPKNVKIIIKGDKNSQIYIENTKFDFNKMDTPYSVPSNYKKINIK